MVDLTPAQEKALRCLAKRPWVTPSEIGAAMTEGRQYPMKPQGAGRIGGAMATRLVKAGLAQNASYKREGFPAYEISQAGRLALLATPAPPAMSEDSPARSTTEGDRDGR